MSEHNSNKGTSTSLIVGNGEIGRGIFEVLNETYEGFVFIRDIEEPTEQIPAIDFLHICIPFKDEQKFIDTVKTYKVKYNPDITIIHSTVSPGVTRKIGGRTVHSPVRGKHPDLAGGVRTFVKFIGNIEKDPNMEDLPANIIAEYFIKAGIKTQVFNRAETTELGKIMSTTQYGWFIVLAKEIKRICDEMDLSFTEVYTIFNKTYNEGYDAMGMENFHRPVLDAVPGPIGGHCVVQNSELIDNPVTQLVKQFNKIYETTEK